MQDIYIISGLGADHRVFKYIDFGKLNVHFIEWIAPLEKESLSSYAQRISENIKHEKPILIGLSFGGMVAAEIAKLMEVDRIIFIASVKTRQELPPSFKTMGKLNIHKMLPSATFNHLGLVINHFFGLQSEQEKELLKEILEDHDLKFYHWAIDQILNWENEVPPSDFIHIHGDQDRVFPIKHIAYTHLIKDGGHLLTLNKAREVGKIIREYCR